MLSRYRQDGRILGISRKGFDHSKKDLISAKKANFIHPYLFFSHRIEIDEEH